MSDSFVFTNLFHSIPVPEILQLSPTDLINQMLHPPVLPSEADTEEETLQLEDDDHLWLR